MDDLELIKQKINVVDLIQEYIPLKKAGVNYKARCPFHNERTASFMVSPERGIWHCFGCDKGGDIFKFVMEKEGLEFKDALELLAQKAGVTLKRVNKEASDIKERYYQANQKAAQFYQYLLTKHKLGKNALEYLKKRGLNDKTIEEFGLGYSPQNWEALTKFLKKRGFNSREIVDAGLGVASNSGCYDRFRGRIIFPLFDIRDRIIGFSGRVLSTGEPKYLNSPQTAIFDKRRFLFGLHLAKTAIKEKNEAIIAEGEMDMILSYQAGVKNIVSSKGTALTEEQIEILKKYCNTLLLCFDTDFAGDAAARRGIEMADRAGLNIKVITVLGAKDPAELCQKDPKAWEKCVEEAVPIYDYYLQSVEKRYSVKKAADKKAVFNEILSQFLPIWDKISNPVEKEHYINKLAALLQIDEGLIRDELGKLPKTPQPPVVPSNPRSQIELPKHAFDRRKMLEEYLIALLLHIPLDHTYVPNFPETLFTQEELKQIYVMLVIFLDSILFKGKAFKIGEFVKTLPDHLVTVADRLYLLQIDERLLDKKYWQKEVDIVVSELKKMLIKTSLEKLSLQIKSAQAFDKMEQVEVLNKRFRDLSVKLKNL